MNYLLFDCDGVLVDSEILATHIVLDLFATYGYKPELEDHVRTYAGMIETDILAAIQERIHIQFPDDILDQLYPAIREAMATRLEGVEGMPALVQRLSQPKAVVSNSGLPHVYQSLELIGLRENFGDRCYSSHQVPRPKPFPDLYDYAVAQLGWPKAEILVIEDSIAGITAAKAAGLTVIGFLGANHIFAGHAEKALEAGADYLAEDAHALEKQLERLLA